MASQSTTESVEIAVRRLDSRYADFAEDYAFMAAIARKVDQSTPTDMLRRVLTQQCRIAYQIHSALLVLVADGFGISAAVVGRSLFEYVVGVLYLIKHRTEQAILADFVNYGVVALYEAASMGPGKKVPASFTDHYGRIKSKFGSMEKWHRKSIAKLAFDVGLGETYRTFYRVTSSVAHGDALAAMMEAGVRFNQIDPSAEAVHGEVALEGAYGLMSVLYDKALPCLDIASEMDRRLLGAIALKRACRFAGVTLPDPNLVN